MNDQQSAEAIRLYQLGHGYKTIARMMGFKSATSIRRVITRAGLNDQRRACVAPETAGYQQPEKGTQGAQKDYSKDPVLMAEAKLFAQRQTALMFNTISDIGFVLRDMPMADIEKLDPKFWDSWEDVETGTLTEQEAERLKPIARSESGLYEVLTRDASSDMMLHLGYFERPRLIELMSGRLPVDNLRAQAVWHAIREAIINNTVKHAPDGFNYEAARLSGEIQKAKSSLRFCGVATRFATQMAGVKPTQAMLDKDEREKKTLQGKLTDLQAQWSARYGEDYERFILNSAVELHKTVGTVAGLTAAHLMRLTHWVKHQIRLNPFTSRASANIQFSTAEFRFIEKPVALLLTD